MSGAARSGDAVVGVDTHLVVVSTGTAALPHPFSGRLQLDLSQDVLVNGRAAATRDSVAINQPPHIPTFPGMSFVSPPANRGSVQVGSPTVLINGRPAARVGDQVRTCNDPVDAPTSSITTGSTDVLIG